MNPLLEVDRALRSAAASDALVTVALPADVGPIEARFGPDGVFWSRDFTLASEGVAASVVASGASRFGELRQRAGALLSRVRTIALGPKPPRPRLFGGLSFHAREPAPEWAAFGQARFVLPRLSFVREAGREWICLTVAGRDPADQVIAELDRALATPRSPAPLVRCSLPPPTLDDERFVELVSEITDGIAAGRFDKVVAARSTELELAAPLDACRLLAALPSDTTRFALARGPRTFAGASPELLVAQHGLDVHTEALAGSVRAGDPDAWSRLLASDKERSEHRIVRDAIVRALSDVGTVTAADRPEVRALRHVTHLATPIQIRLAQPRHVLELAQRLHPTPAVGGEPREAALEFLARQERFDRGWYAAPFGWFDAEGNGQFCVALRAGLFEADRARLYAGAGIVAGSEPHAELAETELKLAALRELVEARA